MKTISVKTSLLPAIIIFVIAPIILFPVVIREFNSMWEKSEFYFFTFLQILFFLVLSVYTYFNIKNNHWTQKYLINAGILIAIGFYYYESLFYGFDIPTLVVLSIITIIFIIPALLILQLIATLIKKYLKE